MKKPFRERLAENDVLVADGAMGTMLYSKGIFINRCFDELNITNPKMVQDIHRSYIDSGADLIETNTFGGNWYKLMPHGLEKKLYKINYLGARLAREVAGNQVYVAGSIGPLGRAVEPIGQVRTSEALEIFKQQALPLLEGEVDLFILETFNDLQSLKIAVAAVRSLCDKPVIASLSFTDESRTVYGVTPRQAVQELNDLDIDVVGVNCSSGPQPIFEAIEQMVPFTTKKLSAMPNAGTPRMIEGRLFYLASPEYFAEYAKRFIQTGVSIVGGCCGTTPEHIRAIKSAVKALRPVRDVAKVSVGVAAPVPTAKACKRQLSPFAQKLLAKKFVTCIELTPPRSSDVSKALQGARLIQHHGVDAVNIPDGPRASARISPLALAVIIEREVGMDTILHYTCRDRNILGMQSDLLGAAALGLRNILLVTGDPPKLGDYPTATAVFNVDSIGLIRIVNNLNHSQDVVGNPIDVPTSFFLGAGVNPAAINYQEELHRLRLKIDAGAEFLLTQPIFDMQVLDQFLKDVEGYHVPIIAGILPLASFRNAEFLHNEVPGMSIPASIRSRLQASTDSDTARKIGIEIAQEMLLQLKSQVQGVYLMPPFGRYESALSVLEVL